MKMKKYTHLFFDLDNTLWDFKTNSKHAMKVVFDKFELAGMEVDFEMFYKIYSNHNDNLWKAYRKIEIQKKELTRLRFQLTFNDMNLEGVDACEMNDLYLAEMPKQAHLVNGATEVLDYLKQKGYRLFVITNGFREVQHKKLQSSGLALYFEKIFISEEIKCPKPGKEIFEHAVKSSNARKSASLMIGDDWEVDILGGIAFGIDSAYYSQNVSNKCQVVGPQINSKNKVFVVSSLFELIEKL